MSYTRVTLSRACALRVMHLRKPVLDYWTSSVVCTSVRTQLGFWNSFTREQQNQADNPHTTPPVNNLPSSGENTAISKCSKLLPSGGADFHHHSTPSQPVSSCADRSRSPLHSHVHGPRESKGGWSVQRPPPPLTSACSLHGGDCANGPSLGGCTQLASRLRESGCTKCSLLFAEDETG